MAKKAGFILTSCMLFYVILASGAAFAIGNDESLGRLNKWVDSPPFEMIKDESVKIILIKSFGSERYNRLLEFTNSMGVVTKLDKINLIYFHMQDEEKVNRVTVFIDLGTGAVASCWHDFNYQKSNMSTAHVTTEDYWIANNEAKNKLKEGACEELFFIDGDDVIPIYNNYNHN